MANKTADDNKRALHFTNEDDIIAEVQSLLTGGYTAHGNWNLGQTCAHLSDWMRFPMDGFPRPPLPMRAIFWLMKVTVAKSMKRKVLAEGFKGGTPTAPPTVYAADEMSDQQGVEQLIATIDRARSFEGELHPSPLFGPIDHETWKAVTLRHAEHHLGYLQPK